MTANKDVVGWRGVHHIALVTRDKGLLDHTVVTHLIDGIVLGVRRRSSRPSSRPLQQPGQRTEQTVGDVAWRERRMEGRREMLREFRAFIARGNVVDLAVAVVIGAAFGAVITAFVHDMITPIIGMLGGVDFAGLHFTINGSTFFYGSFLNALLSFFLIALAVFFFVVKPLNVLAARHARGKESDDPDTRQCPECLSDIPVAASRCAFCTTAVPPSVEPDAAAPA